MSITDLRLQTAVDEHIASRYKEIKPDSCGSCQHKLYETGDCINGDSLVVEWHDKQVWFSLDGDRIEVDEYPQEDIHAERDSLRERVQELEQTARINADVQADSDRRIAALEARLAAVTAERDRLAVPQGGRPAVVEGPHN